MATPAVAPPVTPIPRAPDPDDELKKLRAVDADNPPKPEGDNPRAQEKYSFAVELFGLNGKFQNKILTIQERLEIGPLAARITKFTNWDSLDFETRDLALTIAHLTLSLVQKPAWFKMGEMKDPRYIYAVYAEVSSHEAFFRGDRPAQAAGNE